MNKFRIKRPIRVLILGYKYPFKIIDKIFLHLHLPLKFKIPIYKRYRNYVIKKIEPELNESLKYVKSLKNNTSSSNNKGPIWIFWWQGINNMPLIVKRCYQSIVKHANGHKIIFLNKNNVKNYSNIPEYIYLRLYHHDMSLTEFSDVLRFNLLCNHGGLWIDSTMYCSGDLSRDYFSNFYTSGGYSFQQSYKLLASKWTEFLIGGNSHNEIFSFMNKFLELYWKHHNYLIDYLLADSALDYAYQMNIDNFKLYVDHQAWKNNPNMYELVNYLNDKFNIKKYKEMSKNTNLFKLTYKKKFNSDDDTFYHYLIENKL